MSVNFGNSKIGKIYVGSTEIAKVYHGSTLVFDNMKKIPAYGYSGGNGNVYLLGSNSTSGVIIRESLSTLKTISGTLGASGSSITVDGDAAAEAGTVYTYESTKTYNGIKLYLYTHYVSLGSHTIHLVQFVIEDAKVGSNCGQFSGDNDYGYSPSEVTENSMNYYGWSYNRVSANDTNYTRIGYKQ